MGTNENLIKKNVPQTVGAFQLGLGNIFTTALAPQFIKDIRNYRRGKYRLSALVDFSQGAAIKSGMKSRRKVNAPQVTVFEQHPMPETVLTTVELAAGGATLTVDNTTYLHRTRILYDPLTKQSLFVKEVTGDPSSSLTTGQATISHIGGTAAILPSGTRLQLAGTMGEEGAGPYRGLSRQKDAAIVNTQEFTGGGGVTNWAKRRELLVGNVMKDEERQSIEHFKADKEGGFLFSQQAETTGVAGNLAYTMDGLLDACDRGHYADAGGDIGHYLIGKLSRPIFEYADNGVLYAMGSTSLAFELSNLPEFKSRVRTLPTEETLGYTISEFIFQGRTLRLIEHPRLREEALANKLLIFDPDDATLLQFIPFSMADITFKGHKVSEWELLENVGMDWGVSVKKGIIDNLGYVG